MQAISEDTPSPCNESIVDGSAGLYLYIAINPADHLICSIVSVHRITGAKDSESGDTVPAILGISRIWTHPDHRRSGLAMQLLKLVQERHVNERRVEPHEIAFSAPTRDGRRLAQRFLGDPAVEKYLYYT